jgi:16S rRNA (guanine527-N7)-methyltransferase
MDIATIEELLRPFLPGVPSRDLLQALDRYLDLLLRWNQRLALTASHDPKYIVVRHIGESLFAAAQWVRPGIGPPVTAMDIGSGAGFPGIPLKLYRPSIEVRLVEAHGKKATFLREVVRRLELRGISVVQRRAEELGGEAKLRTSARGTDEGIVATSLSPESPLGSGLPASDPVVSSVVAELVMLRAVERFDTVLPIAARLVEPGGRIGLLVAEVQVERAVALLPGWSWDSPVSIPLSDRRVVLTGRAAVGNVRYPAEP